MSRAYLGSKCKLCRREGAKLFLKGDRCLGEKCAMIRHLQSPGQHGMKFMRKSSAYSKQLREKQKAKRIYNVSERELRNYFEEAKRGKGATGVVLLSLLERRLDNVVYRLKLAVSRRQSRKLVTQKKFAVNSKTSFTPSIRLNKGDVLTVINEKAVSKVDVKNLPIWLGFDEKKSEAKVLDIPEKKDMGSDIDEQLIVEFYSR